MVTHKVPCFKRKKIPQRLLHENAVHKPLFFKAFKAVWYFLGLNIFIIYISLFYLHISIKKAPKGAEK